MKEEGEPKESKGAELLLFLTVLAAPVALAFESLLRALLFPPEFEDLRWFLRDPATALAWALVAICGVASIVGLRAFSRSVEAKLAALEAGAPEEKRQQRQQKRQQAVMGSFLLLTAFPQIPAILATVAYMFGARLLPVGLAIGVASVGVILQALRARASLRPRSEPGAPSGS